MKKTKKIISLLSLCLLMLGTALAESAMVSAAENTTEFAGGNGTEGNPYQVSTPEQLNNVRNYLNAYFIQTQDIDMTEATAEGGTFYNDGSGWEPICVDYKSEFKGTYDGGNHRIIGLKSDRSNTYVGLFGYNNGNIKNLGMDGGAVSASYIYSYAGGIAGYNYSSGSITNCYNTGTVTASSKSRLAPAASYAGGIAGRNNDGSITNCYNTGKVSSTSQTDPNSEASSNAGGIAGYNDGGSITNCYYLAAEKFDVSDGLALTLQEMKLQGSYEGFDFDTVWSISPGQNNGYPTLRAMSGDSTVETGVTINITEKSYDSATGTYHLTVNVHNQGDKPLSGTVLVSAYDRNWLITTGKYVVTSLAPDGSQMISAELTTNGQVEQLKVFCWNMKTLRPLCDSVNTAG